MLSATLTGATFDCYSFVNLDSIDLQIKLFSDNLKYSKSKFTPVKAS